MRIEKDFFSQTYAKLISYQKIPLLEKETFTKSTLSPSSYFQKVQSSLSYFFSCFWNWIKWVFCCGFYCREIPKSHFHDSLINVWKSTQAFFENPQNKKNVLILESAVKNTHCYHTNVFDRKYEPTLIHPITKTEVLVKKESPIDSGLQLKREGMNPVVLNPGHANIPGGRYTTNINGIEEEICRRSGLAFVLDSNLNMQKETMYPLLDDAVVYSPNVPVIRHGMEKEYAFMERAKCLSFLTSAPLDSPKLTPENQYANKQDAEEMQCRMYTQLLIAQNQYHDSIVLCPFGCGSLNNPFDLIAKMYLEIIENYFPKNFKKIVFAIPDYQFNNSKQVYKQINSFCDIISNYNAKIV